MNYDDELRRHNAVLHRAIGVRPGDRVLDIGCGAGATTRQVAQTARSVLGVDISAAAIERARAEPHPDVTFEQADAQLYPFPPAHFDLAISRFGTMFFADPVAAFVNIRRALRPSGRLVMMVWQAADRNEWAVEIRRALGAAGAGAGPNPFSLADPPTVTGILQAAGFTGVTFTEVDEPVYYGPDVTAALDWVHGWVPTTADDHLRRTFTAHLREDGVWLDSRAWVVEAAPDGGPDPQLGVT
ncbi:class I SAM-dependent methyltransferase [Paractinoplanes toevensis]|uniref:Methyltransferase n=1 Tax=Paractinoplanes toevensis TaxID=571911 RepID=A0A919W2P6_9ACTN|nr:class I SAM-dependent methyltransferase [Actinoplanes toevensis]GIM93842.1 methyltransferase [Actinoplanes toevensis]